MTITDEITFDKIVEKTKKMLGKNYRGDKEMVPVYSVFTPIEGHTDAFLAISNNNFSNEDTITIQEKTKNLAWWVANKGYIVDDTTKKEIPALIIYGSEIGTDPVGVLNFEGKTENNFYLPIKKTDITGTPEISTYHLYIKYILDEEIKEFTTDINGLDDNSILINEQLYKYYSGRLYPEDKIIKDSNIIYPIYLISNLDYYNFAGEEPENLNGAHNTSFIEQNNLEILQDVCTIVTHEAGQWTNRFINDSMLNDCWPVIVKCSCMAYLNRGAEGLGSQSELGQQNVYNDWITVLHQQLINRRYIL